MVSVPKRGETGRGREGKSEFRIESCLTGIRNFLSWIPAKNPDEIFDAILVLFFDV